MIKISMMFNVWNDDQIKEWCKNKSIKDLKIILQSRLERLGYILSMKAPMEIENNERELVRRASVALEMKEDEKTSKNHQRTE